MPTTRASPSLKRRLFARDGWLSEGGVWSALCAFGCGAVLTFETASVDRYPIPGRAGGRYKLSNARLSCIPCNSTDGGRANRWAQALMPGLMLLPRQERCRWWRAQLTAAEWERWEPEWRDPECCMHGIPLEFL